MTHVDAEDLATLARTGTHVVHCPKSNMKLASGVCPVRDMQGLGINVALGTDGAASNNDLDMLGEMKFAALLSKLSSGDPRSLGAEAVLRMATVNGARALGWEREIGSLEAGKAADLIAIDLESIETLPCYEPMAQLVYATPRSRVTHVWVNGRLLLDNRGLTTIDEEALLIKARRWQARLQPFARKSNEGGHHVQS
jgi:5-methylthioadenosine/S-adenosylhomocysteine deaminase